MASLPPFLEPSPTGVRIRLKVQPRAANNEVSGPSGDELKIRVTAPPVDSAANEAVLEFLAEILHCRRGALQLVRGQTARHKVVLVTDPTLAPEIILARLTAAGKS
jgi:uncharacterized protein (TIGR00251 family)